MNGTQPWDASWLTSVARGETAADTLITGGKVLSVHTKEWLDADVVIASDRIAAIVERSSSGGGSLGGTGSQRAMDEIDATGRYIVPGYIDAHVHVESSKVTIGSYASAVVPSGTTTIIAEPHEIANVLGVRGTQWFMDSASHVPLDCWFMIPSCVPASKFESAGAVLELADMRELLMHSKALGIGELMNFPAIIAGDTNELAKVTLGRADHADGHAPGVTGRDLDAYVAAGIHSDHESTTADEALEKRRRGMWVLLREASNARNLEDLLPLVKEHGPEFCAFCTDDREPDFLLDNGHIDQMLKATVAWGIDPIDALLMATLHPALAHNLRNVGHLTPGARANLVILPDLTDFIPDQVFVGGKLVAAEGTLRFDSSTSAPGHVQDTVNIAPLTSASFDVVAPDHESEVVRVRVIGAHDGQLTTDARVCELQVDSGLVQTAATQDISKLAVVERHQATGRIGIGFVQGLSLDRGAIASTVAHDAHNIVVAGVDDASMRACCERLAQIGGGIAVAEDGVVIGELALPIAGLMSDRPIHEVANDLDELHELVENLGSGVDAPFMMLSFLALSVIPDLKLTDQGYIDVNAGQIIGLFPNGSTQESVPSTLTKS